ncbi:hypothetical protein TI39_contig402g00024 [Zymoseptoria brevis]|uniref:Uncharacterized protein n=1 Tax=Zymoseptoria brevis TaxID=1047168 RepID=A0A0F4GMG0_9PEZI|nr:hypothetical protein TI39_contig402g00024 [Zymoseptoria brevis]
MKTAHFLAAIIACVSAAPLTPEAESLLARLNAPEPWEKREAAPQHLINDYIKLSPPAANEKRQHLIDDYVKLPPPSGKEKRQHLIDDYVKLPPPSGKEKRQHLIDDYIKLPPPPGNEKRQHLIDGYVKLPPPPGNEKRQHLIDDYVKLPPQLAHEKRQHLIDDHAKLLPPPSGNEKRQHLIDDYVRLPPLPGNNAEPKSRRTHCSPFLARFWLDAGKADLRVHANHEAVAQIGSMRSHFIIQVYWALSQRFPRFCH